jgi:hypothetical protein
MHEIPHAAIVENDDFDGFYAHLKAQLSSDFTNENTPEAIKKYSREATAAQLAVLLLERFK